MTIFLWIIAASMTVLFFLMVWCIATEVRQEIQYQRKLKRKDH